MRAQPLQVLRRNRSFPSGVYGAVSAGDYNQDGWLDVAIPGRSGQDPAQNPVPCTSILRNTGHGIFVVAASLGLGPDSSSQGSCSWADYDRNGDLDLLVTGVDPVTGYGETVAVLRNQGDFAHSPALSIQANPTPSAVALPAISLEGRAGREYLFQTSSNMVRWSDAGIFMNYSGSVQFTDSDSTNPGRRFYRARLEP